MDNSEIQKQRARKAVLTAVRSGALVRPKKCERCKKPGPKSKDGRATIQGHHHKGYGQPLDVQWLCVKCHRQDDLAPNGEDQGLSKLTWKIVKEIRRRYIPRPAHGMGKTGMMPNSLPSLGLEFGVHSATIFRIVKGLTWKERR